MNNKFLAAAFFVLIALLLATPVAASVNSIVLGTDNPNQFVVAGGSLNAKIKISAAPGQATVTAYLLRVYTADLANPDAVEPKPVQVANTTITITASGKTASGTALLSIPFAKQGIYKVFVEYSTENGAGESRFWYDNYKYYLLDGSVIAAPAQYTADEYIKKYESQLLEIAYGDDSKIVKAKIDELKKLLSKSLLTEEEQQAYAKKYVELINITSNHLGIFKDDAQKNAMLQQVFDAVKNNAAKTAVVELLNNDYASLNNIIISCNSAGFSSSLPDIISSLRCDSYAYTYQRDLTAFTLKRINEQQSSGSEDVLVRLVQGDSSVGEELTGEFKETVFSTANALQEKLMAGEGKVFAPKSELLNIATPGQAISQLNIPKVIEDQDINSPFSERMAFLSAPQTTINYKNCLAVVQNSFYKGSDETAYCSSYVALINLRSDLPAIDSNTLPSPVLQAFLQKGGGAEGKVAALDVLKQRAEKLAAYDSALDYATQIIDLGKKNKIENSAAVASAQQAIATQYSSQKKASYAKNCIAPFTSPQFVATMTGAIAVAALTGGTGGALLGYLGDATTAYSIYSISKNSIESGKLEVTPCEVAFLAVGIKTSTTLSKLRTKVKGFTAQAETLASDWGVTPTTAQSGLIKFGKALDILEASWLKATASFVSKTPRRVAAFVRGPIKTALRKVVDKNNGDTALKALESPFHCKELFCSAVPQIGKSAVKQVDSLAARQAKGEVSYEKTGVRNIVPLKEGLMPPSTIKTASAFVTSEPTVPQLITDFVKQNDKAIIDEISRVTGKQVTSLDRVSLLGKGRFKTAMEVTYTSGSETGAIVISAVTKVDDIAPLAQQLEELQNMQLFADRGIGPKTFFGKNTKTIQVQGEPRVLYFSEFAPQEVKLSRMGYDQRDKLFGQLAANEWQSGGAVADPFGGNIFVKKAGAGGFAPKYVDVGGYGEALKPWQQLMIKYSSGELYFFDSWIKNLGDFFEGYKSIAGADKTRKFLYDTVTGLKNEVMNQPWFKQPAADKAVWILHDGKGFAEACGKTCNEIVSLSAKQNKVLVEIIENPASKIGEFEAQAKQIFPQTAKNYNGRYDIFSHATQLATEDDIARYTNQFILPQIKEFALKNGWTEIVEAIAK